MTTATYSDKVSLDEIEQAFLADRKMYLSAQLSDIFYLEIYHSELEDAEDDDCVLILMVGTEDAFVEDECVTLNSEAYPLEQIIEQFNLDRQKVMWAVSKDEPHSLTVEEMRAAGHTDEEIQKVLKNREILAQLKAEGHTEAEAYQILADMQ